MRSVFNQVFNENPGYKIGEWQAGGRLGGRAVLWPIDTNLAVWEAYIKTQLEIATQVSLIKVKVTVT